MSKLKEVGEKLDSMGWTLTKAIDPVDGSEIVVLDGWQVVGLVEDYESALRDFASGLNNLSELLSMKNHQEWTTVERSLSAFIAYVFAKGVDR